MINIEQIRGVTRDAAVRMASNRKKALAAKKARDIKERKEYLEMLEQNVIDYYSEKIKKAASQGKHALKDELGGLVDGAWTEECLIEQKHIKKYYKEFNPTFKQIVSSAIECDSEGCVCGRREYDAIEVSFSW